MASVMASYGLCRTTAYKWLAKVSGHGKQVLTARKGTGRPPKLTAIQKRQVFRWINGRNPLQYGFDSGLWARAIVRELIIRKFAIPLSITSVGTLLAELRLTPQKPLQRAYQRDPRAVQRWQRETYPALVARTKREKAEIYFWDESGFRADAVHGKTWAERGKTPVVSRPGQHQGISAALAVNAKGAFWFATYQGDLSGELFIELLKGLMYRRRKPPHLVVDGLPAHKNKVVKDYVASTDGRLTLHFLPGYAPDLNPDELVHWRGEEALAQGRETGGTRLQTAAGNRG